MSLGETPKIASLRRGQGLGLRKNSTLAGPWMGLADMAEVGWGLGWVLGRRKFLGRSRLLGVKPDTRRPRLRTKGTHPVAARIS